METSLHVALAQTLISPSPRENLQAARRWMEKAADLGIELIVFPEMFMALPEPGVPLAAVAEPLDGPFVSALSALAQKYTMAVICGCWETVKTDAARAANVAVAVAPDGSLMARYHKIHLFDAFSVRESEKMTGGNIPPPVFTLKGLQLGLAICYDLRFPELFRNLARRGAEAIIVPSAWYSGPLKEDHWLTLLKARAIENTLYTCGANLCGGPFSARSAIFDPFGAMVAGSGEAQSLVCAMLNRQRIADVRAKLPTLTHLKEELFHG